MSQPLWHLQTEAAAPLGPLTPAQLQQLVREGRVLPHHRVRKDGMANWVAASEVKGLLPSAKEAATLPPRGGGVTADYVPGHADADATLAPTSATQPGPGGLPQVPGYELLTELGRGGMGVVYKARHRQLKRLVAVKMVIGSAAASPEARARFQAEAEAVARLQHPNIVQVFEIGEVAGQPFYAMEFVPGGGLDRVLQGQPQPPAAAAALLLTLANAMHAAHQAGIVHRDLKPANVLLMSSAASAGSPPLAAGWQLTADVFPKITDFGLAKSLDSDSGQTKSGAIMGTPSYMAPEQAEGKKAITARADVYALGAILYELLTGRPPFRAATALDTVLQVISAEAVPPSQFVSSVPRDLETICMKCLQKDPKRRYASAKSLAGDLKRFLAGEPVMARPVSRWERGYRWCRRHPAVTLLSLILAMATLGGLAAYAMQVQEINRQYRRANRMMTLAMDGVDRLCNVDVERLGLATLASTAEKLEQYDEAVRLCQAYLEDDATDRAALWENARTQVRLATLCILQGNLMQARPTAELGVRKMRELTAQRTDLSPAERWELARGHLILGHARMFTGDPQAGFEHQQALEVATALLATRDETRYRRLIAECHRHLGILAQAQGQWEQALHYFTLDQKENDHLTESHPERSEHGFMAAITRINTAGSLRALKRLDEARECLRAAIAVYARTSQAARGDVRMYEGLGGQIYLAWAAQLVEDGNDAEAAAAVAKAVELIEPNVRDLPKMAPYLAPAYNLMAMIWIAAPMKLGPALDRAVMQLEAAVRLHPQVPELKQPLATALAHRAMNVRLNDGRAAEALTDIERSLELTRGSGHGHDLNELNRAVVLATLKRYDQAQAVVERYRQPRPHIQGTQGDVLVVAAGVYAALAATMANDTDLPSAQRTSRAAQFADEAMACLQEAKRVGLGVLKALFTPKMLRHSMGKTPLASRPDFQDFLQHLSDQ